MSVPTAILQPDRYERTRTAPVHRRNATVRNKIPLGIQLVAGRFREDLCLDAAQIIEERADGLTPIKNEATGARSRKLHQPRRDMLAAPSLRIEQCVVKDAR
jgi:hypothetical protein